MDTLKSGKMLGSNLAEKNLLVVPPLPRKYLLEDWTFDNRQKNRVSEDQEMLADRILTKSDRILSEVGYTTQLMKRESDYRLQERMIDIKFLLEEGQKQKNVACDEEEVLKIMRRRLEKAIKFLEEMGTEICQKCIILRDNRLKVDVTCDQVDNELRREMQVMTEGLSLFVKALEETNEQIRRLRATIYLLDRDIANKSKSYNIDEVNLSLRPTQQHLSIYEGALPLNILNCDIAEWEDATNKSIQNTAKEINSSCALRSYIDLILNQVVEDITNQVGRTNESFKTRIMETSYTKTVLENILNNTVRKVNDVRKRITLLEEDLSMKEGYLAVAQMRLGNRAQRQGIELCSDRAQIALEKELETLRNNVGQINQLLAELRATLRYLLHVQVAQNEEINVKANTLKIDEVDCMTIRNNLKVTSF